jgi:hypothetical protein
MVPTVFQLWNFHLPSCVFFFVVFLQITRFFTVVKRDFHFLLLARQHSNSLGYTARQISSGVDAIDTIQQSAGYNTGRSYTDTRRGTLNFVIWIQRDVAIAVLDPCVFVSSRFTTTEAWLSLYVVLECRCATTDNDNAQDE